MVSGAVRIVSEHALAAVGGRERLKQSGSIVDTGFNYHGRVGVTRW